MKEFNKRKKFSKDFKRETVRMVLEEEQAVSDLAFDLGIHPNTIYRWVKEFRERGEDAFPGNGQLPPAEAEIRRLKQELARTREERDILKKAIAFFSRTVR
ncbi:MAG: transposase [Calditrichaeota bacterium]|nr:MAG: transposase [Calditrichota bacterium]